MVIINKAASIVEEISFINEHNGTTLSTYHTLAVAQLWLSFHTLVFDTLKQKLLQLSLIYDVYKI